MNYKEALNKCMYLCSKKEYCQSEMAAKLMEWELPEKLISEVLNALVAEKFIDDLRYAKAFTNDKFRFNHWGKIKIRFHLKQKKLASELINQVLEAIDEQTYQKVILEEINKKSKTVTARSDFERTGKIARSIIGKGFEPEMVFSLLRLE
jgi:regulatory protein